MAKQKKSASHAHVLAICLKQVAATQSALVQNDERTMTPVERQRTLRPRKVIRNIAPKLAELAQKHGVNLGDEISAATVLERLDYANQYLPLFTQVSALHKQLADIVMRAESQAWFAAMANYSTLKKIARRKGDLQAALAPIVEALALGKSASSKKSKGTKAASKGATVAPAPAPSAATANGAVTNGAVVHA